MQVELVVGEVVGPFDVFWDRYPRKVDKKRAHRAFDKALEAASVDEIMSGLEVWCGHWKHIDTMYIPHPTTWLNNERWDAEPPSSNRKPRGFAAIEEALGR